VAILLAKRFLGRDLGSSFLIVDTRLNILIPYYVPYSFAYNYILFYAMIKVINERAGKWKKWILFY